MNIDIIRDSNFYNLSQYEPTIDFLNQFQYIIQADKIIVWKYAEESLRITYKSQTFPKLRIVFNTYYQIEIETKGEYYI